MTVRRWLPAVGAALMLALQSAADEPKNAAGDPLPEGAKMRLGSTRMRDAAGWSGATAWGGVALAADGRSFVALPQTGGPIKIDVTTGQTPGGSKPLARINRMDLCADGTRGVVTGFNGPVAFDAATGAATAKLERRMPYGEFGVALAADGKVFAAGGVKDEKAKTVTALVWDVTKNAKRAEVEVLQNQSASVALSADAAVLATWGSHYSPNGMKPEEEYSKVVQFWDAATGKERAKCRVGGFGVLGVALSPDGAAATVSANGGGSVWLIDTSTGAIKRQFFGRGDQGGRMAFSPDGKRIAIAGFDGAVQIYDATTGERQSLTVCPTGPLQTGLRELKFTGNDTAVVWAAVNAAATVWEVPSGRLLSPAGGHTAAVETLAFTADGKTLLTAGGGVVLRWDAATGKAAGELRLRPHGRAGNTTPTSVRISADARTVQAGDWGTSSALYDATTGDQLFTLRGPSDFNTELTLCADTRTFLVGSPPPSPAPKELPATMKVAVWDTTTGAKLTEIEPRFGSISTATTSPDRKKVVTLTAARTTEAFKSDYYVTGWDLGTGKKLGEVLVTGSGGIKFLIAAPDNTTALVAGGDGHPTVVDYVAGKVVREIDTDKQTPTAVSAFSSDGKFFAIGSGYSSAPALWVYEWETGKRVKTFRGHAAGIISLAFSPDGKMIASGSQDTTVLLWDLAAK